MPFDLPLDVAAQDIHSIVEGMKRPGAPGWVDPNARAQIEALIAAAKSQAAQNVPPLPDDLNAAFPLPPTPQSALTADRENRFAGMPPPAEGHLTSVGQYLPGPATSPEEALREQIANELSTAIPNLKEQGWAQSEYDLPPGMPGIGLQSGGSMRMPHDSDRPRGVLELQSLDRANQAAQANQPDGGILGALRSAIMGPPQQEIPNQLSPDEQSRLGRFNAAGKQRDRQQAARQANVTQRAQMKGMARDVRMQGAGPVMFSKLQQAMSRGGQGDGGGELGPPDPQLAVLAPQAYQQQLQAWNMQQSQQRLGQEDKRLAQQDTEGNRRFDLGIGEQRADRLARQQQHTETMARAEANSPIAMMAAAMAGNQAAAGAVGFGEDQQIAAAVDEAIRNPTAPPSPIIERTLTLLYPLSAQDWWGGEKEFLQNAAKKGIPDTIAKQYWDRRRAAELSGTPLPAGGGVTTPSADTRRASPNAPPSAMGAFSRYSAF